MNQVTTEAELRTLVKRPLSAALAKIEAGPLEAAARRSVSATRLAFVTMRADDGSRRLFALGGEAGFIATDDRGATLRIPVRATDLDVASISADDGSVGVLLVVPGVSHTLRVNGRASVLDDGLTLAIEPAQSYAHCAKAFVRSNLWKPTSAASRTSGGEQAQSGVIDAEASDFIAASPFALLGTSLDVGEADVSPRGDPPGFVAVVDENTVFIPDRPGNRIADSLRNIIANPSVALLLLVPNDDRVLELRGRATITTDPALCAAATVNGKTPTLGIVIDVSHARMRHASALADAGVWDSSSHAGPDDVPSIGSMVADPSEASSLANRVKATAADRLTSLDYRFKLY